MKKGKVNQTKRKNIFYLLGVILFLLVVSFFIYFQFNIFKSNNQINDVSLSSTTYVVQGIDKQEVTKVNELNNKIIALNNDFKNINSKSRLASDKLKKDKILKEMISLAKQRKTYLLSTIKKDIPSFFKLTFDSKTIESLPKELQLYIEKEVTKEGVVDVIHYDDFENKKSINYYYFNDGNEKYDLYSTENVDLVSRTKVKVSGMELDKNIVVFPIEKSLEIKSTPLNEENLREQKTAIILVNFENDRSEPATKKEIQNGVNNKLNNFYREISYNQTWFNITTFGWYNLEFSNYEFILPGLIPSQYTLNFSFFVEETLKVADSDIYYPEYERIIILSPYTNSFSTGGQSTVGKSQFLTDDGLVNFSAAVVSFSELNNLGFDRTIRHEVGHGFGVDHANSMKWNGSLLECEFDYSNSYDSFCEHIEYANPYDIMGGGEEHINSMFKKKIGWLNENNFVDVTDGGIYSIFPLQNWSNNKKGLKVHLSPIRNLVDNFIYIEYRQPIFNNYYLHFSCSNALCSNLRGAQILLDKKNILLDTVPGSPFIYEDSALLENKSFVSPFHNISITTLKASSNELMVFVNKNRSLYDLNFDMNINETDVEIARSCTQLIGDAFTIGLNQNIIYGNYNITMNSFLNNNYANIIVDSSNGHGSSFIQLGETKTINGLIITFVSYRANKIRINVLFESKYRLCEIADFNHNNQVDLDDINFIEQHKTNGMDINGDYVVDEFDYNVVKNCNQGKCDINKDGVINADDVLIIYNCKRKTCDIDHDFEWGVDDIGDSLGVYNFYRKNYNFDLFDVCPIGTIFSCPSGYSVANSSRSGASDYSEVNCQGDEYVVTQHTYRGNNRKVCISQLTYAISVYSIKTSSGCQAEQPQSPLNVFHKIMEGNCIIKNK